MPNLDGKSGLRPCRHGKPSQDAVVLTGGQGWGSVAGIASSAMHGMNPTMREADPARASACVLWYVSASAGAAGPEGEMVIERNFFDMKGFPVCRPFRPTARPGC